MGNWHWLSCWKTKQKGKLKQEINEEGRKNEERKHGTVLFYFILNDSFRFEATWSPISQLDSSRQDEGTHRIQIINRMA